MSSAAEQSATVHSRMRLEKPMSFPPIVRVTMSVWAVTDWIWEAIRSLVDAPEQATNVSDVFGRWWATSHGYAYTPRRQEADSV